MSGTKWVEAGGGATTAEICDALALTSTADPWERAPWLDAMDRASFLKRYAGEGARTNLVLTGQPFTLDDLGRIASPQLRVRTCGSVMG